MKGTRAYRVQSNCGVKHMDDKERVRVILEALRLAGPPTGKTPLLAKAADPLDTLILTILSQATSDLNSARAFDTLKARFRSWKEVLEAPVEQIEAAIASGGLARQKAPRIQALLAHLAGRGRLSLDFMADWDNQRVFDYLTAIPGVGPKTAACVLFFGLGRPALPVDTHVHRLAGRLGLAPAKWPASKVQRHLEAIVPREVQGELHLRLIDLGRAFCRPRNPGCGSCPVRNHCRSIEVDGRVEERKGRPVSRRKEFPGVERK